MAPATAGCFPRERFRDGKSPPPRVSPGGKGAANFPVISAARPGGGIGPVDGAGGAGTGASATFAMQVPKEVALSNSSMLLLTL